MVSEKETYKLEKAAEKARIDAHNEENEKIKRKKEQEKKKQEDKKKQQEADKKYVKGMFP